MHKLLSIDNQESKGQREVGQIKRFSFHGICFSFGSINSSRVESITFNEQGYMIVKTRNSTYTFKEA